MKTISELASSLSTEWIGDWEKDSVVLSSIVTITRNYAGFNFNGYDRESVYEIVKSSIDVDDYTEIRLDMLGTDELNVLKERMIITKDACNHLGYCTLFIHNEMPISITVNGRNHIRIRGIEKGFSLREIYKRLEGIESSLSMKNDYSYKAGIGYLTANYLEAGSGVELCTLVNVSAISLKRAYTPVSAKITSLNIKMTQALEDVIDNNANTMFFLCDRPGKVGSVPASIKRMKIASSFIRDRENEERGSISEDDDINFVTHSHGVLKYSRSIECNYAIGSLLMSSLGVHIGLSKVDIKSYPEIIQKIMPGHINIANSKESDSEDIVRANIIRKVLSGNKELVLD